MSTASKLDCLGLANDDLFHGNPPLPDKAIAKAVKYNKYFAFEMLIMYLLSKSIIKINTNCQE